MQPKIWYIDGPSIEKDNGTLVNITCSMFGDPFIQNNITWTKTSGNASTSFTEDKEISFTNSTVTVIRNSLIIAESTKIDSGSYKCEAWNDVGSASSTVTLAIRCKFYCQGGFFSFSLFACR